MKDHQITRKVMRSCERDAQDLSTKPRVVCWDEVATTLRRPVTLDMALEKTKLSDLLDKQRELESKATQEIVNCNNH
jgi:hypothetical protein